jgi:hypothetical protein
MGYLILNDYKSYIQPSYFNQLVQGDDSKRLNRELSAMSIIKGKLQQKYDINLEFTDTTVWDITKTYSAGDRVYLDADLWVASTSYVIDELVLYQGNVYLCGADNSDAVFTPTNWQLLGEQYDIFFARFPINCTYPPTLSNPNAPVFNLYQNYKKDDVVYWRGNTWICNKPSGEIAPSDLIVYYNYKDVPYYNVFPDGNNNNQYQFWKDPTVYVVDAGQTPTKPDYWTKGDNRDKQILLCMQYIVIYLLAPLIAPHNVPEAWDANYKSACFMLDEMAKGLITVDVPVLQPYVGRMTSYGGKVKNKNCY